MRFQFDVVGNASIRVIPEIPNYRLCRLEGLNGIGKTLAVRLLEVATGQQPYAAMPNAWRSLKAIERCVITVTGLDSAEALVIELSPGDWNDDPGNPGQLGRATLGGRQIPFESLPSVLSVVRIAGDQTLAAQIVQRIEADAALVDGIGRRVEDRLRDVETVGSRLLELTRPFSRGRQQELIAGAERAGRMRNDTQAEVTAAASRTRALSQIGELEAARSRLAMEGPRLEEEVAGADSNIQSLDLERVELAKRRDELLPAAQAAEGFLRTIRRLTGLRERQAEAASNSWEQVQNDARELGIEPQTGPIALRISETQGKILELSERRQSFAVLPELDALLRRVEEALDEAARDLPDGEIVLSVGGARLSIADVRNGVRARREELTSLQAFAALSEVDAELADLRSHRQKLSRLGALLAESRRIRDRLARTDERLKEAYEAARQDVSEQYSNVIRQLERVEQTRLALVETRATLRYSLGLLQIHGSATQIDSDVARAKAEAGVLGETGQALAEANTELEVARAAAAGAEENAKNATSALSQYRRQLHESIDVLRADGPFKVVIDRAGIELPTEDSPEEAFLDVFEQLAQALQRLQQATDAVALQNAALKGNLDTLSSLVAHGDAEVGEPIARLSTYYEAIVGDLLSRPEMQHALFDQGTFESVSLLSGELSWHTGKGEPRRRPFEAFSSGESAFAYVLASALSRTAPAARNRVLVLDEFGAFIEAGKMQDLIGFLSKDVLGARRADQVVVILPLREPRSSAQLDGRGYFAVEEFVA